MSKRILNIAWVIDFPIKGSGGHKTWFYYINELVEQGHQVDIYVNNPHHKNSVELKAIICDYLIPTKATIKAGWDIKGQYDILFATWHKSAKLVADYPNAKHKMYFVQDLEQLFNPMGDEYIKAVSTYKLGLEIVTMGRWISNHLIEEYGAKTHPLFLGADTDLYKDQNLERENIVSFIYQPEKPRRCPGFVYETIKALRYIEPSARIVTYGAYHGTNLPGVEHWGLIPIDACAELYSRSKVGVCFSSTNPSRIPFEMMSAGLPVVELYRENNLYDISEQGSILVEEDAYAAATAIKQLLNDPIKWHDLSEGGKQFMQEMSIKKSVQEFMHMIDSLGKNESYKEQKMPLIYTKDPVKADPMLKQKEKLLRYKVDEIPVSNDPLNYGSIKRFIKNYLRKSKHDSIKAKEDFLLELKKVKLHLLNLGNLPFHALSVNKRYELLSSDVFDTIVRRRCHPDEIKYQSAIFFYRKFHKQIRSMRVIDIYKERLRFESLLGQRSVDAGKDFEYEIHEVFALLAKELLSINEKEAKEIAEELFAFEKHNEQHVIYPDPKGIRLFNSIKAKQKILLSDFYMKSDDLKQIIPETDKLKDLTQVCSSIDFKLNKNTGNVFTTIEDRFKVKPADHLHIGDNKWSDVKSPQSKGINATHFINVSEEIKRKEYKLDWERRQKNRFPFRKHIEKRLSQMQVPQDLSPKQQELFKAGVKYSPIFYFLILNIIEHCIKENIEHVYYFTREGIFFEKIHQAITRHNPIYFELPKSEILEVSRVATFSPSIQHFGFDELRRIWNQYTLQSIQALATTLGLPKDSLNEFAKQHDIDPEETSLIWKDKKYEELFQDKKFLKYVNQHINSNKELLLKYLSQKGIDPNKPEKIAIVDIGWRGTIQDNLAYILPKHTIFGFYFGMIRPLNYQPGNTLKLAYGPNFYKDSEYFMQLLDGGATFIEMLSNSSGGSSTSYYLDQKEGKVKAKKEISKHEDEMVIDKYIKYFQQGVLAAVKELSAYVQDHGITSIEARPMVLDLFSELIQKPPFILTDVFFNLKYSETFGIGSYYDMRERSSLSALDLVLSPISHSHRKQLLDKASESQWIHGYWKYNDRTGTLGYIYRQYLYNKGMVRNLLNAGKDKLKFLSK